MLTKHMSQNTNATQKVCHSKGRANILTYSMHSMWMRLTTHCSKRCFCNACSNSTSSSHTANKKYKHTVRTAFNLRVYCKRKFKLWCHEYSWSSWGRSVSSLSSRKSYASKSRMRSTLSGLVAAFWSCTRAVAGTIQCRLCQTLSPLSGKFRTC